MQNVFLIICLVSSLLAGCASAPANHDKPRQVFGLIQVRGTPDRFLICTQCPSPTAKTVFRKPASAPMTAPATGTHPLPGKLVVHFDHAAAVLKAGDQAALARLVKALPEVYRLRITGYTDNTTARGTTDNKTLARQRAVAVRDYLRKLGVEQDHITLNASPLCCYLAANNSESGRAKNRRTEIIISTLANEGIQP